MSLIFKTTFAFENILILFVLFLTVFYDDNNEEYQDTLKFDIWDLGINNTV